MLHIAYLMFNRLKYLYAHYVPDSWGIVRNKVILPSGFTI